jgi:hypothetical protein
MTQSTVSMLASYARVLLAIFTAAAIGAYLDSGKDVFAISLDDWKTYVAAGIAAAIPVILRWLNPNDTAYGLIYTRLAEPDDQA